MADALPELALSVRQPWAWAIIHGGKDIENRSRGSIRAGRMDLRRVCIHAATGMRQIEYDWAVWRLLQDGVTLPRPDALVRRAIIGTVDVVDIVEASESPWFGGPCGLVLRNPVSVEPIPSAGALGYFRWERGGDCLEPSPWMQKWNWPDGDRRTEDLFEGAPIQFRAPPSRPFGPRRDQD